jgi:hypothetical protein
MSIRTLVVVSACVAAAGLFVLQPSDAPERRAAAGERAALAAAEAAVAASVAFVPNLGQWDLPYRFVADFGATTALLGSEGFRLVFLEPPPAGERPGAAGQRGRSRRSAAADAPPRRGAVVDLDFVAASRSQPIAGQPLPWRRNFFLGNEPERWRTEVPAHASVRYQQLYRGVDVRCYCVDGHFEYDLELAPGADLQAVAIDVRGADALWLDADGALVFDTAVGPVRQPAPTTFVVEADGGRRPIRAAYRLLGPGRFGFAVPEWDGAQPLVVDPGILYSAVFGGVPGTAGAIPWDADVADNGVVTIVGFTNGLVFPTTPGAFQAAAPGGGDLFVTQLDPSLPTAQQLRYTTYLGGSGYEDLAQLAIAPNGTISIAAYSDSSNYPTTAGAFAAAPQGGLEGVVTRLDPALSGNQQLVYSTYLGGATEDIPTAIGVGFNGQIVVAGFTNSTNFPVSAGAYDTSMSGAFGSAFVTVLDPAQSGAQQLNYSTYLGGSNSDEASMVALDVFGRVIVGGRAESTDFPTTPGAFQTVHGSPIQADVFVSLLDPAQSGAQQLVYATLLGGAADDLLDAMQIDPLGSVVELAGTTGSANFPVTANAYQPSSGQPSQQFFGAFLARLDLQAPGAQALQYSTFLHGTDLDFVMDLEVDADGVMTVLGYTYATDFPTTPGAYATTFTATNLMSFVSRLDPSLPPNEQLLYSTYFGADSGPVALALDAVDNNIVTIVGTADPSHPTTPGAFGTPSGNEGTFVTRLDLRPTGVVAYGTSTPGCSGPLAIGVRRWPQVGNAAFELTCRGASPAALGVVILNYPAQVPSLPVLGFDLWVAPAGAALSVVISDANGRAELPLPIPAQATLAGLQLHTQFAFYVPGCPPQGWSASNALSLTIQP